MSGFPRPKGSLLGTGSPLGAVFATYVGQFYFDEAAETLYVATKQGTGSWAAVGGGGGELNQLLRATLGIEIGSSIPIGLIPWTDVILNGPPTSFIGEILGSIASPPLTLASPGSAEIAPLVNAPDFSHGALVLDPVLTSFTVMDVGTGGGESIVVNPTGTTTPLSIPTGGIWQAAAANDWSISEQSGADLSIAANGSIISSAALIYTSVWEVAFSQVPTA